MNTKPEIITPVSRRHFLKNSTLFAASAAAVASFPNILHAQTKPKLNAAIIGLGGRGSGAGKDFLDAAKEVGVEANIVALADLVPDQVSKCRQNLSRLSVSKCFSGFDAYLKGARSARCKLRHSCYPARFPPRTFQGCRSRW
ncbi:MAG: twin-arginine translocation signal domain-containing protein [Verrucomicrobiota bacterium]